MIHNADTPLMDGSAGLIAFSVFPPSDTEVEGLALVINALKFQ